MATVECETRHLTLYYASREHAEQAWYGIIHKIAPLLGSLRESQAIVGSEEDRAKREYALEMSKRALITPCQEEAAKFLVSGRYELAIPGAIFAITFIKDIHGNGALDLVPPYLQLAEANLGLGRLGKSEEFLSLANWSILKNPDCSQVIRSQLHRNFGRLYLAQGKLDDALRELTKDVYCLSLEKGPEHVVTSGGYYHMAGIFYTQHRVECALAFYDKVIDIWYKFLASLRSDSTLAEDISESQLQEGVDMIKYIEHTRVKLLGDDHIASAEAKYTLGLLYIFIGDKKSAFDCLTAAEAVYSRHLGPDHPSTRDVIQVLKAFPHPGDDGSTMNGSGVALEEMHHPVQGLHNSEQEII